MIKTDKEKVEKTFTNTTNLLYNDTTRTTSPEAQVEAQLKSDKYLPTNDVPFRKMLSSPENINISEGLLNDLAQHDPLKALQINTLVIESPYTFKPKNKLKNANGKENEGMLYTEVDYACSSPNGALFLIELQCYSEAYLEQRIGYNVGERYTANYADESYEGGKKRKKRRRRKKKKRKIRYESLRPVVAIIILSKSYYKDDPHPIRYFRPSDASIGVYKKDLLMGLEIYLELDKDVSNSSKNIQDLFHFFRTGEVSADAADYLKEAANQMRKINYTPEEREIADSHIRAQMKRHSEDEYVREEGRKEGREEERAIAAVEKAELQQKAEAEKAELQQKAETEKAEVQQKAEAEKAELQQKAEAEKAEVQQKAEATRIALVQEMIKDNSSIEMIERYTGLSTNEIKYIIANNQSFKEQ